MEIKFKDYLGLFFLGSDYSEEIWERVGKESQSLRVFSYDENISNLIFGTVRRNLQQDINADIKENLLDISSGDLKCFIDVATFASDEDKVKKIIDTAYIISYSTGLKPTAAIKMQYIKNVAKLSGWKINKLVITYIKKNHRGLFQTNSFVFSDYFSISNDKKDEFGTKNIVIDSYLNDEESWSAIIPFNNRGNSIDYFNRSIVQWRNADEKMLEVIENYQNGLPVENLSLAIHLVRRTDGDRWLTNKEFVAAVNPQNPVVITSDEFEVLESHKTDFDSWDFSTHKVYFDFETISLPFSAFDWMEPYQQIPVQYSVIKTDEFNNIVSVKNRIYDFEKQEDLWQYFKEMIEDIYWSGAKYVSHNKNFEDMCIQGLLIAFNDKNYDDFPKIEEMTNEILASQNSIDTNVIIANHFEFKDFPGKSSIKHINKWFEVYRKEELEKYGVLSYSDDLEINNGLYAQNELTKLYFGLIKSDEIEELKRKLIAYCENDVRGMIPLVDFVEKELENNSK